MELYCKFNGNEMEISWNCHINIVEIEWKYNGQ